MAEWTDDEPIIEDEDVRAAMTLTHEEPEILISARHFWRFFTGKREVSPGLFIIQTTLGPLVNGEANLQAERANPSLSMITIQPSNIEQMPPINEVEYFFNLESLGIKDDPSQDDDQVALQLFNKSIRQMADGRYSVKWPWKDKQPDLPSNFHMACRRLTSTINKLQSLPEMFSKYDTTINDQLQEGIIEPAERAPGTLEHYLPHHAVITTKLRVVYDGSARSKGGNSLNDCLYRGPVILSDLIGMLLRFRNPVGVAAAMAKIAGCNCETVRSKCGTAGSKRGAKG